MSPSLSTVHSPKRFVSVFLALTLVIVAIGTVAYLLLSETLKFREHERLQAVSSLKAQQIESWMEDRIAVTKVLTTGPFFNDAVAQLVGSGSSSAADRVLRRLNTMRDAYHFSSIELFDMAGNKLLTSGVPRHDNLLSLQALRQQLAESHDPVLLDFHREATSGQPLAIALAIAVRDATSPERPPLGIVFFNIDPYDHLFPLIQSRPTPSPSAESILVMKEGDKVVLVNEVRHSRTPAMSLRFPLSSPQHVCVQSFLGASGLVEGVDYGGVPVLAAIHPVKNTSWRIVSKIDRDEVFRDLRLLTFSLGGIVLLAVALTGTILMLIWRQQRLDEVTDRVRASGLLQTIIDGVDEGILLIGSDGKVLRSNRRFQTLWNIPDELLAIAQDERLLAYVLEQLADPAGFLNEVKRLYPSDEVTREILNFKDGRVFECYSCTADTEGGRARLWSFRDITDRRKAEDELKKFSEAIKHASEAFVIADPDFHFQYINPAFERLFGYSLAEVKGKPLSMMLPDDASLAASNAIVPGAFEGEKLRRSKDGRNIPVLLKVAPILDAEGLTVGLVATITDLTQWRQLQEALREGEAKYRSLFESANDGIFLQDARGFVDCNTRGAAMYGLSREQVIGRSPADFCPERQPGGRLSAEVAAEKTQAAMQGKPQVFEWQPLRSDGTLFDVEITLNRIEMGGSMYLQAIVRDITERKKIERQLQREHVFRQKVIDSIPGVLSLIDSSGRFLMWNHNAEAILGRTAEEIARANPLDFFDENDKPIVESSIRRVFEVGEAAVEAGFVAKDGTARSFFFNGFLVDVDGQPAVLSVGIDISERKRAEAALQQALRELNNLIARIPAGVYKLRMCTDGSMRFDYVSPRWCELLEVGAEEVYQNPDTAFARIHPDDLDEFVRLNDIARKTLAPFQWEGRLREGLRAHWLHIESSPTVLDNGDILWEGVQYDITATKEHEERLDKIAHYDALTGVPNRILLDDRMHQAIAQTQRSHTVMAVCYLDLDGFKSVNDTYGHEAGDKLLVEIARRLPSCLRGGDTVARIGGDEFVLLLLGFESASEYATALRRILDVVREPVDIGQQTIAVSASLGISLYPQDGADPDILLRLADQAMYQAKQSGKNQYHFFDPDMELQAREYRDALQRIE